MKNLFNLEGRTALITGASSGLGKHFAKTLHEAGAFVIISARRTENLEKLKKELGNKCELFKLDVTSEESVSELKSNIESANLQLDILINNAALYAGLKGARFEQLDEDQWDRVMRVNIKGTWLTSRAVVGHMRASGGGSIINIASLAAVFGLPYGLDYVASKAAVIGMTRGMARELGPDHIRVNAVAPSAVMTEGTEEFFGEKFEKAKAVIAANQLIPRNLETEDLTGTIVYLASDASRFVTGQTHMVDGGSWFL